MAVQFVDPLFARALKQQSFPAQAHLVETGLDDPGVFESFLADPASVTELAHEPPVHKLDALLVQAKRAARVQRAEFANRGPDVLARADRQRKRKLECETRPTPTVTEGGRGTSAVALLEAPVTSRPLFQTRGRQPRKREG